MANAAITVDLNAKIANFETELKKATGSLDRFEKKGSAVAAGFKSAFGALGAAVSVGAIVAFTKSGIDAADSMAKLSARVGVSVKDLASLKLAAEQSDTSLEGVGAGIARLSRSIGEAENGNKKLAETLKTLGVNARAPKEAFFQLADATKRIQDPAQRAALLSQVLGKSYQELVPLLNQGGDAMRESAAASESFADSMAKLAPDAEKFNDQLAEMKHGAAGLAAAVLVKVVPALNEFLSRVKLVNDLVGSGGLFNAIMNTAGTDDLNVVMKRLNKSIAETQNAIDGGADDLFKEKLNNLIAMRDVLINSRVSDILEPPKTETQRLIKESRSSGAPLDAEPPNTNKPDPQGAFVEKLRREASTLGLTGEALQRYEAAKLKLSGTNAKLADSYISQIAAFKQQQDAARANNKAFDEAIRQQDEMDAAIEGSIKSVREWIAEQEYEVSLIGLTNSERETAIRMRELETAGVDTQTESYRLLAQQVAAANSDRRGLSIISGTQTEKAKEFMGDVESLNNLFFAGKIGAEQYSEAIDMITSSTEQATVEMDEFAKNAAESIQKTMADFLFDPFADGLDGMLEGFGKMLQRMIADAAAAQIARELFGGLSDNGTTSGNGWIGGALELVGGLFASANGNAFANGAGLSAYSGTIVSSPTVFPFAKGAGLMGEAGPEVILPLKRGANGKLGVESGGGGGNTINVHINGSNNAPDVRRAAAQGAREAMGMMSAAKRYA